MIFTGKSLDKIAELRENNKLPKPGRKKRQKQRSAKVENIKLQTEVCKNHTFVASYEEHSIQINLVLFHSLRLTR